MSCRRLRGRVAAGDPAVIGGPGRADAGAGPCVPVNHEPDRGPEVTRTTTARRLPDFRLDGAPPLEPRRTYPADLDADIHAAPPPGTVAGLESTVDATGLTLFATVRR